MKRILILTLASICIAFTSFGQTKKTALPLSVSTGAVIGFPIGNSVNTKTPMYGQQVKLTYTQTPKVGFTLSGAYTQNKFNAVQLPLLGGAKYAVSKNVYVGAEAGYTLNNNGSKAQFTYSPSVGVDLGKFTLDQRFLGSIWKGKSVNNTVGLVLSYKL